MEEEKKYQPILPFNEAYGVDQSMYDVVHYVWDKDLCGENPVKLESGNFVKYYRTSAEEPVKIGGD